MANSGIQPKQDDINSICEVADISVGQAVILLKVPTDGFGVPIQTAYGLRNGRAWQMQWHITLTIHQKLCAKMCVPIAAKRNRVDLVAGIKQAVGTARQYSLYEILLYLPINCLC